MVVSIILKIKFWHTQISVPKIGVPMSKAVCINPWFSSSQYRRDVFGHLFCISMLGTCFFFLIAIHSMQGRTATMRHGVTKKEAQKILQGTENLFRKNLQL